MATVGVSGGDKWDKVIADISERIGKGNSLKVGFIDGSTYEDGTFVAQVAFWNEYGTKGSPPRPFFRQTIAAHADEWGPALAEILQANDFDMQISLGILGEGIKDQLVESIINFSDPANADSTVARKGFNKPLINSHTMETSITHEVGA